MTIEVVRLVEKPLAPPTDDAARNKRSLTSELLISFLTSSLVHALLILTLALLVAVLPGKGNGTSLWLSTTSTEEDPGLEQLDLPPIEIALPDELAALAQDALADPPIAEVKLPQLVITPDGKQTTGPTMGEDQQLAAIVGDPRLAVPTAYRGRSGARKQALLESGGGTEASERAVEAALAWFARHQLPDGGWSLDHRLGPCAARCSDPGSMSDARIGATALALLPFLGAGHTHEAGEYRPVVRSGLNYLVGRIESDAGRGVLVDQGRYYSHGLAAITLCEAFALTLDQQLQAPAQAVIQEIVFAQDPEAGGWRYYRHQPGDTSVLGWQLMALKSARMAYLMVPEKSFGMARRFLDSVESDREPYKFGYLAAPHYAKGGREQEDDDHDIHATSAIGMLSRMYLGWRADDPILAQGVRWLSREGPSITAPVDLYYNYYATQVLRHVGGPRWDDWNQKLREFLIDEQQSKGHASGSWFFTNTNSDEGGRLYCTSLATMILEVYYRHLPIYSAEAAGF